MNETDFERLSPQAQAYIRRKMSVPTKQSKYRSKKVTVDGLTFDSRKEAKRYGELLYLLKSGEITDLETQKKFVLIPAQYEQGEMITKGKNKGQYKRGAIIERECAYYADFVYKRNGETIVEDVKSPATKTDKYTIKRKLMLYKYGIRIREV